jgi:hypothetical protein
MRNGLAVTCTAKGNYVNIFKLSIVLLSAILLPNAIAQMDEPESSGMEHLAFMIGEWEGTGWHDQDEKGVLQFVQRVSTRAYMNGEILVSEQVVLDAANPDKELDRKVVIYSYDAGADVITARSMLPRGRARIMGLRVNAEGFSWRNQDIGGRYYTKRSREGKLITTAFHTLSGPQYFESVLEPIKNILSTQLAQQNEELGIIVSDQHESLEQ